MNNRKRKKEEAAKKMHVSLPKLVLITLMVVLLVLSATGCGLMTQKDASDVTSKTSVNDVEESAKKAAAEASAQAAKEKAEAEAKAAEEAREAEKAKAAEEASKKEAEEKAEQEFREKVAKAYNEILNNVSSDLFGDNIDASFTKYEYSAVSIDGRKVPLLLVKVDDSNMMSNIRIFSYNEETEKVDAPSDILTTGVAAVGGYRGSLTVTKKDPRLEFSSFSSGTGEGRIYSVDVTDGKLELTTLWEGRMDQLADTEFATEEVQEIKWSDTSDRRTLESYAGIVLEASEVSKPAETSQTETVEDANSVVLEGSLVQYNHDQLVALQGVPDPTPDWEDTEIYTLLLLAIPTEVELPNSGGGVYTKTVNMVHLRDFSGDISSYGNPVKVRFSKDRTCWPSDVSLPIGEPSSFEYTILN